jgi:hypothetical protein
MDDRTREELRIRLSITLAMLPTGLRRDLGERLTSKKDPAIDAIVEALIDAVEQNFRVNAKPVSAVQKPLRY